MILIFGNPFRPAGAAKTVQFVVFYDVKQSWSWLPATAVKPFDAANEGLCSKSKAKGFKLAVSVNNNRSGWGRLLF